jgi:hypothetical protein
VAEVGDGTNLLSVRLWVFEAATASAGVGQLKPFFSKGVNGGLYRNLPLTLREHDTRRRGPSQPSLY